MLNPKPVPRPTPLVVKNGSKIRFRCPEEMPTPLSLDFNHSLSVSAQRADPDVTLARNCLAGIGQKIHKNLADFTGVARDPGKLLVLFVDVNAVSILVSNEVEGQLDRLMNVNGSELIAVHAGEGP